MKVFVSVVDRREGGFTPTYNIGLCYLDRYMMLKFIKSLLCIRAPIKENFHPPRESPFEEGFHEGFKEGCEEGSSDYSEEEKKEGISIEQNIYTAKEFLDASPLLKDEGDMVTDYYKGSKLMVRIYEDVDDDTFNRTIRRLVESKTMTKTEIIHTYGISYYRLMKILKVV